MQWKRWGRRALALGLCFTLAAPAGAVGVEYPDLDESHWAYDQMDQARELGILSGGSGGAMDPDGTLTWGQFLTMVGRTFYRETYDAAPAGDNWADQGYQAALDAGVLEEDDFLPVSAQGLEAEVNRQSAAEVFYRVVPQESLGGNSWWYGERDAAAELSDWNQIPAQYREAVSALYEERILNGTGDGRFDGEGTLTRAAGAVLLMGVLEAVDSTRRGEEVTVTVHMVDREGQTIQPDYTAQVQVGESYYSLADAPEGYRFVGPYYDVSALSQEVTLQYRRLTADELAEERAWNQYQSGEITYEQYMQQDFWLRQEGENPRKYTQLFGRGDQRRFENQEQAAVAMTTVTVPVWKLSNGQKVSSTVSFQINAGLAEDVKAIFTEIYNDPEQFPIYEAGGYSWRGDDATGEHNCGSAIDLNANENYQVREGQALVGSLWQPGVNPYSIGPDSSVVRIFKAHGWSWGGDAWAASSDASSGYHDYMHFSYMGM
mgnify:CR=1 FL=1